MTKLCFRMHALSKILLESLSVAACTWNEVWMVWKKHIFQDNFISSHSNWSKKHRYYYFSKWYLFCLFHANSLKWFSVFKLLLKLMNFNLSLWHSVVNPTYNGVLKRSPSQEVISKEKYLYIYLFGQIWRSGSDFLASHYISMRMYVHYLFQQKIEGNIPFQMSSFYFSPFCFTNSQLYVLVCYMYNTILLFFWILPFCFLAHYSIAL